VADDVEDFLRLSAENADQVAFSFVDGTHFQGLVEDVEPGRALLSWAPSPFYAQATGTDRWSPDDEWFEVSTILPATLERFDWENRRWHRFQGDEG